MPKLKPGAIADDKPVKLTVELAAAAAQPGIRIHGI
jgi:hypothetical protein